jgi:6,7-dimethyl-8-ribityllumazine synthase
MPPPSPTSSVDAGAVNPPPIAVVVSRYNATITDRMLEGAIEAYGRAGGRREDLVVVDAPGAFELTVLSRAAAVNPRFAGVVALGCVIKGQTRHDRYLADAVAQGLTQVAIASGKPVAFGVLTVDTPKQARARAGGSHGNKGFDATMATLRALAEIHRLADPTGRPPLWSQLLTDAAPDKLAQPVPADEDEGESKVEG